MAYPEWVEKHRRKGTNISCIKGKYYLYECTSKYNPEKKRSQKITTKYLGRITEEGLIAPKKKNCVGIDNVSVKEYGASEAVSQLGKNVYQALQKYFPNEADKLFAMAIFRLIERCPFKRISEAYANSYIISNSTEMNVNRLGYSSHRQYDPQINLMMAFPLIFILRVTIGLCPAT